MRESLNFRTRVQFRLIKIGTSTRSSWIDASSSQFNGGQVHLTMTFDHSIVDKICLRTAQMRWRNAPAGQRLTPAFLTSRVGIGAHQMRRSSALGVPNGATSELALLPTATCRRSPRPSLHVSSFTGVPSPRGGNVTSVASEMTSPSASSARRSTVGCHPILGGDAPSCGRPAESAPVLRP